MIGKYIRTAAILTILLLPCPCRAMNVDNAQARLAAGNVTLIDIRSNTMFRKEHIPGAINIPAGLCAARHIPPLGEVIVYGDGLDTAETERAAAALGSKPGLTVEILDGGYPAWRDINGLTTRPSGITPEEINYITYQKLKEISNNNKRLVFMDLRLQSKGAAKSERAPVDLAAEFPGIPLRSSPFHGGLEAKGLVPADISADSGAMYILIDSGDGRAEKTARELKAAGITSFAILAGGDEIVARQGRPGREKQ